MHINRRSITRPSTRSGIARWCGLAALAATINIAGAQTVLPPDVQKACIVTPQDFAKWFKSGTVQADGQVKPADSVGFQGNSLCAFYQWSAQMFLWFTSPSGGGQGHVFDSPVFYNVSADENGVRTLIPNTPGSSLKFNVRTQQLGPHGLQLKRDAQGSLFLKDPRSDSLFKDTLPKGPGLQNFIDPSGVELGQAGSGGALMTQGNSLVYYAIQINDVYAYFLTAQKSSAITPAPTTFPTTQADLDKIVAFAAANGKTLPDPKALAIETKTSWVDASTVDASKFITIDAEVPDYDTSSPTVWKLKPNPKKLKLALVGVHFVGSVAGHPELIWATFEHNTNSPTAAYSYTKADGTTGTIPQSTVGKWLFCANGSPGATVGGKPNQYDVELIQLESNVNPNSPNPNDLVAVVPATPTSLPTKIAPSDTLIQSPWGSPSGVASATNNTAIISLNTDILGMLPPTDVRSSYLLRGATWTTGQIPGGPAPAPIRGSTLLANSTMETYTQALNCFICHQGSSFGQDQLSHIYFEIQKLTLPEKK